MESELEKKNEAEKKAQKGRDWKEIETNEE